MPRSCLLAGLLLLAAGGGLILLVRKPPPLPPGLAGALVFVSDRSGGPALYLRRLPGGALRRLTFESEPVGEPALSHDGRAVAFSMGGRIGIVSLPGGEARFVTSGVDWKDDSPAWRSDDRALLVASRRPASVNHDVHLLTLEQGEGDAARRALTDTPGLDETAPIFAPLDAFAVLVRQDGLFRLDLADGRTRRLTGGFKKVRSPRFLPSGRLVCLWSEAQRHGIDVMDFDGANRETLWEGPVFYRSLAPSPDGRFFVATFTYDLGLHPLALLKPRPTEEVRLLDRSGRPLGTLEAAWSSTNHSADWGVAAGSP